MQYINFGTKGMSREKKINRREKRKRKKTRRKRKICGKNMKIARMHTHQLTSSPTTTAAHGRQNKKKKKEKKATLNAYECTSLPFHVCMRCARARAACMWLVYFPLFRMNECEWMNEKRESILKRFRSLSLFFLLFLVCWMWRMHPYSTYAPQSYSPYT